MEAVLCRFEVNCPLVNESHFWISACTWLEIEFIMMRSLLVAITIVILINVIAHEGGV